MFYVVKWQFWCGIGELVDINYFGFNGGGYLFGVFDILIEYCIVQIIVGIIGQLDCFFIVFYYVDLCYWVKEFFEVCWIIMGDIG